MKCPFCQHEDTQVLDTRVSEEGDSIRRRRRCGKCDKRVTTYERIELSMPIIVKKNGSRTEFVSNKLRGSLMLALRKRPVSAEAILGQAHMTCNKNGIPNDPQKPFVTSGIRLGSPAFTTRGFVEEDAVTVGNLIADVLDNPHDTATIERVKGEVKKLTSKYPVYAA